MPLDLLLTVHESGALERACQRGFWLPVAIPQVDVLDLAYLVVLHPQAEAVAEVAPINSLEFLFTREGEEFWLPFLAPLRHLRHPVPLGSGEALRRWLPASVQEYRLLEVNQLLVAESLAELISGWEGEGHRPAADPAA
ncbi:hypothetical protein NZK32_17215 [Cyanobium sp. FGCU-52]|nr:hypothetical protein [Cyanobium sp. FGCU52]